MGRLRPSHGPRVRQDPTGPRPEVGAQRGDDALRTVKAVSTVARLPSRPLTLLAVLALGVWWAQSLTHLTSPPTGAHAWRETDGLVVARNYCLEHAPFHEPRVNNRDGTDGRTGMELPVLPWLASFFGCASGDFVTPWRVITFAFALLLAGCLFLLARARLASADAGLIAVIALATSPLTAYISRSAQPDFTAAALATLAMLLATYGLAVPAFACACLAALIKLPAAVYLLPVLLLALEKAPKRRVLLVALAGLSAATALAWYRYARSLEEATGITNFGVSRSPSQLLYEWQLPAFWLKNFTQHPFDVWVFPLATVALLGVIAWKRSETPRDVRVLGFTVVAYLLLCGYSAAHHDYYGIVLLPALCLMIAWASRMLMPLKRFMPVFAVCAVLAVAWSVQRARKFWPVNQTEWAELGVFASQHKGRIVVFSEGNPRLFWFTGQVGRFGDLVTPEVHAGDDFGVVDRTRLAEKSAAVEATLSGHGCTPVFENPVAWVCRAPR